jgi:hypothetical protein
VGGGRAHGFTPVIRRVSFSGVGVRLSRLHVKFSSSFQFHLCPMSMSHRLIPHHSSQKNNRRPGRSRRRPNSASANPLASPLVRVFKKISHTWPIPPMRQKHQPLQEQLWVRGEDEIQCGNVVVIRDAARLILLPSSGQGDSLSILILAFLYSHQAIGSSFAIEDATVLANSLLNHLSLSYGSEYRKALEEYARLRVERYRKLAKTAYFAGILVLGEILVLTIAAYFGNYLRSNGGFEIVRSFLPPGYGSC